MNNLKHKNGYIDLSKVCRLISASLMALTLAVGLVGIAHANKKYAAIVVDANNGKILHSRSAHSHRYPASLTKMMTVYVIFEDIEKRKISKTSKIKVSKKASRRPASKLWLKPGQTITVEDAIFALVTKSANDVATAVAEGLEGSQEAFARRMTRKAKDLGMKNTTFKNANGLTQKGQKTTAADMAILGMALRQHFPQHYHYFETRTFKYGKSKIRNHNSLLGSVNGVDGIKTGYTSASGFNLVTSIEEDGRSIVAVVMGGKSSKSRNRQMKSLVNKFLKVASKSKPKPVFAKLPSKVAKPITAPRKKISNDVVVAQNTQSGGGAIADKISQAHEASIGTSKIDISETIKLAWAEQTRAINNRALNAIQNNSSKSQWQIQVTATNSQERAQEFIKEVRLKNTDALRNVKGATKPITLRNGKKLYRARFIGFENKQNAQKACKELIKNKFECMILKV